jgi:glutaredoxin
MTQKAIFYHAGCPVCVSAEQGLAHALDPAVYSVEIVHLGQAPERIAEAEAAGVASVPALVVGDRPYHINFGASLADVKGSA